MSRLEDRCLGALLGLAAGDALGTTLEFSMPGAFEPITDMVGGGPFELQPGQWTDDTSMALCLAESLVECRGFDPEDQMQRYRDWYENGHLSSTGYCFDVGNTVLDAITQHALNGNPFAGPVGKNRAGNGSLMRLAPVPIYYQRQPAVAMVMAAESSRVTHGAPQSVDACKYYTGLMIGALHGIPKAKLLRPYYSPIPAYWENLELCQEIRDILHEDFTQVPICSISGSGYVVKAMEAALWCFARTDTFREGALCAANLGNDADTTAAIYGQLAGAYYGKSGIPEEWLQKLALRDTIEKLAFSLYQLSL